MKRRVAKKVFLQASHRVNTGHSKLTLARAARKVLKQDICPSNAWACFCILAGQYMWPNLDMKLEEWLNAEERRGFDTPGLRRWIRSGLRKG